VPLRASTSYNRRPRKALNPTARHSHVNLAWWPSSRAPSSGDVENGRKDCKPRPCDKWKCGECGAASSVRFNLNPVDSDDGDKGICEPCFGQGRTDKLIGCQPEAIKKREGKQAKFYGSNKKSKH
ncbi:unnamed protein product, partial [Hapterophycus canaliculatus]